MLSVERFDTPAELDRQAGVEHHNGILIPGMTNAHCHLELSFFKGAISQGTGLVSFIKEVIGKRNNYPRELQIERAVEGDLEMWNDGIQACGDISNDTTSFPAKVQSRDQHRLYYHTFAEYFGTPAPDQAEAQYRRDTANVAVGREMGLVITPSPHSTYLMSDKLLKMGADSPRVSIHFMETPAELGLFDRTGEMYEFMTESGMEPDFLAYGSHPRRLVESLPAGLPMLLVHNTQMKEADLKEVTGHFTDVTFVLCPRSNYYIERAFPPAEMFYKAGVRVALGTDSLSSNTSLSMVEEIKWLAKNNPSIPLSAILTWATLGGAEGLGVADRIGSFAVGKHPGAVLLTGIDFETMRPTDHTASIRLI